MKNIFIITAGIFAIHFCQAQSIISSAITSAGTFHKAENFTLNYVIGEPLNTFIESGDLCIAQGVLQVIINSTTDINSVEVQNAIKVYPNPTIDNLIVNFNGNTQLLSYQLFNANGILLSSANFKRGISNIDVTKLTKGNYVLSILEDNKLYKTFKIVKQ